MPEHKKFFEYRNPVAWILIAVGVIFAWAAAGYFLSRGDLTEFRVVTLSARGKTFLVATRAADIAGVFAEQGIPEAYAVSGTDLSGPVSSGDHIRYRIPIQINIVDGGQVSVVESFAETVGQLIAELGIELGLADKVFPDTETLLGPESRLVIERNQEREITERQKIAFETVTVDDPDTLVGSQRVLAEGSDGVREVVYNVRYRNGVEVGRSVRTSRIVESPTPRKVSVGSKIEVEAYERGIASWYRFRGCLCAAHPAYPRGSRLRVINERTGASVIVTVNDFGPQQSVHPGRIIDLDAVAFSKLSSLASGTIAVKVEKLKSE